MIVRPPGSAARALALAVYLAARRGHRAADHLDQLLAVASHPQENP